MKKILLLFIFGSLLFSCSQENDTIAETPQKEKIEVNLTNDEYLSISENNIPDVTENQVIELLTNWNENPDKLKSSSDRAVFKIAKRLKNSTGAESDYYLASINQNQKEGFAVVYGNKLFPQIACYIPEGSINDTIENEGLRIMYNISKESVESSLIRYNSLNKDSLKALAFQKISEEINKDVAYVKENIDSYDITIKKPSTKAFMGRYEQFPLLNTEWHQGAPYNNNYPTTTCANFNINTRYKGRNPAGCVIIALAQAVAFTRPTTSQNFDYNLITRTSQAPAIPSTTIETQQAVAVAFFTAYLRDNVVPKVTYESDCTGTSANTENTVKALSKVNMVANSASSFNNTKIRSSLVAGRVIWIRGESSASGHSWLIDGMREVPNNWPQPTSTYYNSWVNCNFGNGAEGNGFFQTTNNVTANLHYTMNVKIFTDVRKK